MPEWPPGPWRVEHDSSHHYFIYAPAPHGAGFEVCPARAHGLSEAHLIASAPDLYEALAAIERSMLIRLAPMATTISVLPTARIKPFVGRGGGVPANSEQRTEGIERVEAAVEPEGELVEVGLKVLRADAVMAAHQPAFQVAENQVDDGQIFLGDSRIMRLHNGKVLVSALAEFGVATPSVGDDHRARLHRPVHERHKRLRRAVGDDIEPDATGIASAPTLFLPLLRLPIANLHGGDDERLMMHAPALAARGAADIGFVDFDMLADRAADGIAVGPNHAGPQLVEHLERRLIATKAKLPLKLDRRHARCQRRRKVGSPEPNRQRCVGALHDRADRQRVVLAALAAPQDMRAGGEPERLAAFAAPLADKPVAPADCFQIGGASRIVGEQPLELRERTGEWQIFGIEGGHRLTPRLRRPFACRLEPGNFCRKWREAGLVAFDKANAVTVECPLRKQVCEEPARPLTGRALPDEGPTPAAIVEHGLAVIPGDGVFLAKRRRVSSGPLAAVGMVDHRSAPQAVAIRITQPPLHHIAKPVKHGRAQFRGCCQIDGIPDDPGLRDDFANWPLVDVCRYSVGNVCKFHVLSSCPCLSEARAVDQLHAYNLALVGVGVNRISMERSTDYGSDDDRPLMRAARAALAKARGEEP